LSKVTVLIDLDRRSASSMIIAVLNVSTQAPSFDVEK
jgi:hypothetical protein